MRTNHRWLVILTVAIATSAGLAALPASAAPDASLKETMKKMQAKVLSGDAKALSALFVATKAKDKPEFSQWASIVDKGKTASDKGDLDGAKATCKECHDAYRKEYASKYGSKAP